MRVESRSAGMGATTGGAGSLEGPPSTHGLTVVGWLLVCFSVAPLAMAVADRRTGPAWVGAGMLAVGIGAVVIGRQLRARR